MPNWSQERVFGRHGPTNRSAFRLMVLALMVCMTVLSYFVIRYVTFSNDLSAYVHDARAARIAAQAAQQDEIDRLQRQNKKLEKQNRILQRSNIELRQGVRDLVCFTVRFAQRSGTTESPFIRKLDHRYDCKHYRAPKDQLSGTSPGGGAGGSTSGGPPGSSPSSRPGGGSSSPPKVQARHQRRALLQHLSRCRSARSSTRSSRRYRVLLSDSCLSFETSDEVTRESDSYRRLHGHHLDDRHTDRGRC